MQRSCRLRPVRLSSIFPHYLINGKIFEKKGVIKHKMHFDNKEFLCITHTVEHKYISPSSTLGIQLHVSALYVGHLQVVI